MATAVKTVKYATYLSSASDNTWTSLAAITVYLPENSKVFKSVSVEMFADDNNGSTQSIGNRQQRLALAAVAPLSYNNSDSIGTGAENFSYDYTQDYTSYFTTNWSGTSMSCQIDTNINISTVGSGGSTSICAILSITYEYDDTTTTHVKTVAIPLSGLTDALPTTKTSHDTIPDLATFLPESSKTIRQVFIRMTANRKHANSTDITVSLEIDSNGAVTFKGEAGLTSNTWSEWIYDVTAWVTTGSTHTFNLWSSVAARFAHLQAVMYVTYEFNESTSTSFMNSVELYDDIPAITKSTTDFYRCITKLQVQEPNVALIRLAANVYWSSLTTESTKSVRIGTGSFVSYTAVNGGTANAGQSGLMVRNDSPTGITFARGEVALQLDIAASEDYAAEAYKVKWIINYTSDKATGGSARHNHTVDYVIRHTGTTSLVGFETTTTAGALAIPEANYRLSNIALEVAFAANNGTAIAGTDLLIERLSGEGGTMYFEYLQAADVTPDGGIYSKHTIFAKMDDKFLRWTGDPASGRMDPESARRYKLQCGTAASSGVDLQHVVEHVTYHSITKTISGNITNSNGGTVTLNAHNAVTGEKILTGSRSGSGAYSFTWFDDVTNVFVEAYESSSYKGRSANSTAT